MNEIDEDGALVTLDDSEVGSLIDGLYACMRVVCVSVCVCVRVCV